MKIGIKTLYAAIMILAFAGVAYLSFIGLPKSEFNPTDDGELAQTVTIQIAPNTFFDIDLSVKDEILMTDYETYYETAESLIQKVSVQINAEEVDTARGIFLRPQTLAYRVFDESTCQIKSDYSFAQPYNSLLKNEPYHDTIELNTIKRRELYEYDVYYDDFPNRVSDYMYAVKGYKYNIDTETGTLNWYSPKESCRFYKSKIVYGLMSDNVAQLLAVAKNCYKLNITEGYISEELSLFMENEWLLAVVRVNRNTHLIVVTNTPEQRGSFLATIFNFKTEEVLP